MVVMSIKVSDGSVMRSRNENGSCSMNGASVLPVKWKPRKVSAIRDFPPGCGPIVHPVNVVPHEAEPVPSPVTKNHVIDGAIRDFPPGCGPIVHPVNVVPHEPEPVPSPVTNNHVNDGASRDFPPGCGPAVQPVNVVPHEAEPVPSPVTDNHVAGDAVTDEPVVSVVENLVNNEVQNGDVKVDNDSTVIKEAKPKMKFTPRRVSAVRDFPPFCGPNAEEPTEEDRIRINGRRSCGTESNGSVKGKSVHKTQSNESNEASMANEKMKMIVESNKDVEDGKNMKSESSKKVQNIGQACKELVVYTRDNVLKKASPDDDAHYSDSEDAADSEDDDIQDNKPLSQIQKDMNIKNREMGSNKLFKKRPLDDTKKRVYMGDKVKVIMGLKAPSFSTPGIKQKDSTNKPKVHTPITPKNKNQEKVEKDSTKKTQGDTSLTPKKPMKEKQKTVAFTGTLDMVVRKEEEDLGSTKKTKGDTSITPKNPMKKKQKTAALVGTLDMVVRKDEDFGSDFEEKEDGFLDSQVIHDMDSSLPPFGPKNSNDARNKVRKTLRYFHHICRRIVQGEESKSDNSKLSIKRVDLAAKAIMDIKGLVPALGEKTYGPIPGVEVGDEFLYRVELALVGIHRPFQGGIDFVKKGKTFFAVSVVASGGYANEVDKPDCLMYSGSGGIAKDKSYEDQKLERGNLALNNNIDLKYPVRVIRGYKVKSAESSDSKSKSATTYIYDGLYTVVDRHDGTGPQGHLVYRFELKRVPGQPQLAIREVTSKKFKKREGVCVTDIADGKEPFQICAVNTIDDEKPPAFTYVTKIVYPDWYKPIPIKGCECVGRRCSDKRCSCALKNGGEIPYNRNGAIVGAKQLVYECGPSCGCPPSCYNRVTQHGMKIRLEIFKTESRGWGVRSLSSISSGTFICEYVGELLEDKEAEQRVGGDEYLFDIGQNYNDCSVNPDANSEEIVKSGGGFTIDAAYYGNVGRFINHSCVPNLYAQNVIYDQDDKRMPHIMLFAAENIPPLQELTYHYNYAIDTVHDAEGNIKVKNCYCGSSECTGRLY